MCKNMYALKTSRATTFYLQKFESKFILVFLIFYYLILIFKTGVHTSVITIEPKRSTFSYKLPNLQPKVRSSNILQKESSLAMLRDEVVNSDTSKSLGEIPSTSTEHGSGHIQVSVS